MKLITSPRFINPVSLSRFGPLMGWWDGQDTELFEYSSGALVSLWPDLSGNTRHLIQPTSGNQPLHDQLVNGRIAVALSSGKQMQVTIPATPALTMVGVLKKRSAVSGSVGVAFGVHGFSMVSTYTPSTATGFAYYYSDSGFNYRDIGGVATDTSVVVVSLHNGGFGEVFINGVSTGTFDPAGQFADGTSFFIGSTGANDGDFTVCELALYGIGLTEQSAKPLSFELLDKWVPIAEDTFTRADSTTLGSTEVGNFAWTEHLGNMEIVSNGLSAVPSTNANQATFDCGRYNYTIVNKIRTSPTADRTALINIFRYSDSNNRWWLNCYNFGTDQLILGKTVGGSDTTVQTISQTWTPDTEYEIVIECRGSEIKCYVNGSLKISVNDSDVLTATRVGVSFFAAGGNDDGNSRFESVTVRA